MAAALPRPYQTLNVNVRAVLVEFVEANGGSWTRSWRTRHRTKKQPGQHPAQAVYQFLAKMAGMVRKKPLWRRGLRRRAARHMQPA
jgi:hypothetical protein